jgi:hypothetical protein
MGHARTMNPPKFRIALPRIQGRVGAPSLTHLRGNAAIASRRNAASQLKFGTPRAWQSLGFRSALPRTLSDALAERLSGFGLRRIF